MSYSDDDFKAELAQLGDGGPDAADVRATVWSAIESRHRGRRRAGVVLAVAAVVAICAAVVLWPRATVSPATSSGEVLLTEVVTNAVVTNGVVTSGVLTSTEQVDSVDPVTSTPPTTDPTTTDPATTNAVSPPSAAPAVNDGPLRTSQRDPSETITAALNVEEGKTYGVGAPITLTFSGPVTDKAAVQAALTVSNSGDPVEGSWGWLQDEDIDGDGTPNSQVHYRTREFWPAHTDVAVRADLADLDFGGGRWGSEDLLRHFTIGRDLRVEADVASFRLKITVDGALTNDFPTSYGIPEDPARGIRNGVHIVQERFERFDMCATFDYCDVDVKWAVRINNNGEFIHENNSTIPYQGTANVSHGCINLSEANAKLVYDMVLYGDPVTVSNSTGPPLGVSDFNYDWSYTYEQWQELSAL